MRIPIAATSLLCGLTIVFAQDTSLAAVETAFNNANIPKDLQIQLKPLVLLEVIWPQPSGRSITTRAGQSFPLNDTAGPPQFAVRGALSQDTHKFVLAAVDPDAPYPQDPNVAQVRHILQGDLVLGPALGSQTYKLVNETPALTDWIQPEPPADSPPHRYIFLLYQQPKGFDSQTFVAPNDSIPAREYFNISQFAEEVGMGDPIGGSFVLVSP
ncbi:PEBP-like protein [Phanerochaete sordida]|uniref:PEBP-like protein n=1 Tax=Phanerochaete sordida TaxID=48140 RepID=A0A9P3G9M0_9APHY|nr:PEBP-like protein [Phanerochaete sordida]